jgi:uncharacterized protein YjbI with pentapeptide repeats
MANQEHLAILKQGVEVWNKWRDEYSKILPDLSAVNLSNANLSYANLSNVNFSEADLSGADFFRNSLAFANLSRANLSRANVHESILLRANFNGANLDRTCFSGSNLREASFPNAIDINRVIINGANLIKADLSKCNLSEANFSECNLNEANLAGTILVGTILVGTNLRKADLSNADLSGADLSWSILSEANLSGTTLIGSRIYAISAWNIQLKNTVQSDLIITPRHEPIITVDNLEVAQFIYLLLNNKKIRDVIDTITSKVVLILGRFTSERKEVLDALRNELHKRNYTPILFDFEKPGSRDFTETVRTLAHLSRFIIADLTDPSSIPQELQAIVPDLEVPVQPLLLEAKREYSMFVDFRKYHWVLPVYFYKDRESLIASLQDQIIEPADKKARELAIEKVKRLERP